MKGKFFRGILRQLSVLLKNNFKKKKGQRSEVIKKFDVFFYKIHEIQTQFSLEMTRFFVVGFTTKRKQNHESVHVNVFPNHPQTC